MVKLINTNSFAVAVETTTGQIMLGANSVSLPVKKSSILIVPKKVLVKNI